MVSIDPAYRKYLRFQWREKIYEFSVLPFGLSTAPFIFTKIIRPVVSMLRRKGYQSVVYLDDFLLLSPSETECEDNMRAHSSLLSSLGFLVNFNKSELKPSGRRFLGFVFDAEQQSIAIPEDRRRILLEKVSLFAEI